jgi:medium-chain acyl-[acyl-carrier-protein] hydrolase
VLLPGRETRANEAPLEDMDAAAVLIAREMEAHLNGAFAFFGHSMGAALAFEVARRISRKPVALIASAAKAPQFRLGWTPPPEPGDEELIDQLRALGAVAGDEESLSVALPAIKADARLYRNYVYSPAEPFDFPICAYGGESDAGVRQEHLQAWAEQTTAAFKLRIFPGGHFYLRQAPDDFLTALAADLQPPQERS